MVLPDGTQLVIKNTFIDAVEDEDDDDTPPDRSMSDQTHLRSKCLQRLEHSLQQSQPITEEKSTVSGDDTEEEDDEDDAEDGLLERTRGVVIPAYGSSSPPPMTDGEEGEGAQPCGDETSSGPWEYMGYPVIAAPIDFFQMSGPMCPFGLEEGYCIDGSDTTAWYACTNELPQLGQDLPWGVQHSFHQEVEDMGAVAEGHRQFTKVGYEGRLSLVSEGEVHHADGGIQRYLVQFSDGELSRADGVGFVFSNRLPCAKNIQRIVSIFVNQRGRICMRILNEIVRASAQVKTLRTGDWVEMAINLEEQTVVFNVWPSSESGWPDPSQPCSTATFPYGRRLRRLNKAHHRSFDLSAGHLACVVKNVGVTITLGS